ncbi:hypothetical protein E5D57_012904 [Metarhizium anisopliae]|nr:hypothetical protein E5D57_012904 [Metarhizium anisopliae]
MKRSTRESWVALIRKYQYLRLWAEAMQLGWNSTCSVACAGREDGESPTMTVTALKLSEDSALADLICRQSI